MNTTLMPLPKQQYLSALGTPLVGGKVYTYAAGTTNPKATYTDPAGTIPQQNPIVLNVRGEPANPIYWSGNYRVDVRDALGNLVYTVDNFNSDPAGLLGLFSSSGSSIVGYILAAAGAVARWVQDKLRERVSVLDFGADPTGATDSTNAFNEMIAYLASIGGGRGRVPFGTYMVTNLVIDQESVILEGETSGYGYTTTTGSVRLVPSATADFVVRLKGSRAGVAVNAAAYSGLKNLQVAYTDGPCEYGVVIDSGATVMENVIVQGFAYNGMCADQMNANVFRNCTFVASTVVNFGVCEVSANGYINPKITGITSISNTTWAMENCQFRQSAGFGVILRSGVNVTFRNCGFESNKQAGLYLYRPDSSTLRMVKFEGCWFENNYEDYTSGAVNYSIAGNRMLLIGDANMPIAWTSAYQAGYQIVSDSQTHHGGGGDTFEFSDCSFVAAGAAQKAILILSGFKYDFRKCWFSESGDVANLVKITVDAEAVHWHDPVAGNNPYALVASITNAFGANSGSRGAYFKAGTSFGTAELGGLYPELGVFGGPIHFRDLDPNDPRRADPRCLDDYHEVDNFTIPWRTGSALPFAVSGEDNKATKWGREVIVRCKGILTVTAATGGPDSLFCNAYLPFQTDDAGFLTGEALVEPVSGGAAVLNNGWAPMKTNDIASAISALNVFPALAVGMTFSYEVKLSYCTKS